MKLTSQEIAFIDNYLQQSDIIFVDLRQELTDHIASVLEEQMALENSSFYETFKTYMILNKKAILKNNSINYKNVISAIIQFSKTLLNPGNLILGLFLIFGFRFWIEWISLKTLYNSLFLIIIGLIFIQGIHTYLILRKRYLCLENTSFVLLFIYFINLFFNGFYVENFHGNYVSVAMTLFLVFAFMQFYYTTIQKFRCKLGFRFK